MTITKSENPCTKWLIDTFNKYEKSALSLNVISNDKLIKHGIIEGSQLKSNIYKINSLVEKPKINEAPSNLAMVDRYILNLDLFDKIKETETGVDGEILLTDTFTKLDEVYGVLFEGKIYNIAPRFH